MTRREFMQQATVSTVAAATTLFHGDAEGKELPSGEGHGKDEHMTHHDTAAIVQAHPNWKHDTETLAAIAQAGGWEKYVAVHGKEVAERAFYRPGLEKAVACMDEGDDETTVDGEELHLIRNAGSGILNMELDDLLGNAEFDPLDPAYIEQLADAFIARGITVIHCHGGCGAGGIALEKKWEKKLGRKLTPEDKKQYVTPEAVDALVQEFSRLVVEAMQRKLKAMGREEDAAKVRMHFKPIEQLSRPAEAHIAQVIYYDGTNAFKTSSGVLPRGFLVSAQALSEKGGEKTVDLAKAISFGGHGPGELLSGDRKLHVVCIGDPSNPAFSSEALMERAMSWIASLPEDQRNRIVIESFTAPAARH